MRIVLLVVLAVIGLTLARWLGQSPPFEQDLNRFMQDAASQRRREADPP